MSSWLQSSFNNLSDQFGQFTKEVLTEGIKEVGDLCTQDKLSLNKINELEAEGIFQKEEIIKLKKIIKESDINLNAKEIELQKIVSNNRIILFQKEDEINHLKKIISVLKEKNITKQKIESIDEEENKIEIENLDKALLKDMIYKLKKKIILLEKEFQEKTNFHKKVMSQRIKDLENQIEINIKNHKEDILVLENENKMKMEGLNYKYKNLLQTIESEKNNDRDSSNKKLDSDSFSNFTETEKKMNKEIKKIKEELDNMKEKNSKLEFDWLQSHAVEKKKSLIIHNLNTQLSETKIDFEKLKKQLVEEVLLKEETKHNLDLLAEENEHLMQKLNFLKINENDLKLKINKYESQIKKQENNLNLEKINLLKNDKDKEIILLKEKIMEIENDQLDEIKKNDNKNQELNLKLEDSNFENLNLKKELINFDKKLKKLEFENNKIKNQSEKMKNFLKNMKLFFEKVLNLEEADKFVVEKNALSLIWHDLNKELFSDNFSHLELEESKKNFNNFFHQSQNNLENLQNFSEQYEVLFKSSVENIEKELKSMKNLNIDLSESNKKLKISSEQITSKISNFQSNLSNQNKKLEIENPEIFLEENTKLKETIVIQEDLIKVFNQNLVNLLKLFKNKTSYVYRNPDFLQEELNKFSKEKEQMLQLLNDKTNETNNLKNEIHILIEELSESKAAFNKMQQDNLSSKSIDVNLENEKGEEEDMKREAIKKLSQLIKERDFEIEALNKKNTTLLQVLKSDTTDSLNNQFKELLNERDQLYRQVENQKSKFEELTKQKENINCYQDIANQKQIIFSLNQENENLQINQERLLGELESKQSKLVELLGQQASFKQQISIITKTGHENYDDKNQKCSFLIGINEKEEEPGSDKEEKENENELKEVYHKQKNSDELFKNTNNIEYKNNINDMNEKEVELKEEKEETRKENNNLEEINEDKITDTNLTKKKQNNYNKEIYYKHAPYLKNEIFFYDDGIKEEIIKEKEKNVRNLESKVFSLENELDRTINKNTFLINDLNHRENEVNSLKSQLENTREQLNSKIEHFSSLQQQYHTSIKKLKEQGEEILQIKQQEKEVSFKFKNIQEISEELKKEIIQEKKLRFQLESKFKTKEKKFFKYEENCSKNMKKGMDEIENEKEIHLFENKIGKTLNYMEEKEEDFLKNNMSLQIEREQLELALQHKTEECDATIHAKNIIEEREKRLIKDCERLRQHLISMEEAFNKEAIEAEQREKNLRNQLLKTQDQVQNFQNLILENKLNLNKQIETFQLEIHSISEQRNQALIQLSSAQDTISNYSISLSNLQMVLEQFQSEKSHLQSIEIEKIQAAFNKKQLECQQLQQKIKNLLFQLEEQSEAIKAAQRLSQQMDKKDHLIAVLKVENENKEFEVKKKNIEIEKLSISAESKIDKVLIKSLLVGYFHAPPSKRFEAFQVIGHILNFSDQEFHKLNLPETHQFGWLKSFFSKKDSYSSSNLNQSFSELFVNFLQNESNPNQNLSRNFSNKVASSNKSNVLPSPFVSKELFNPFSLSLLPSNSLAKVSSNKLFESSLLNTRPFISLTNNNIPTNSSDKLPLNLKESLMPIVVAAAASSSVYKVQ